MLGTSLFWLEPLLFLQFILRILGLSSLVGTVAWPFCFASNLVVAIPSRLSVIMDSLLTQKNPSLASRKAQVYFVQGLVKFLSGDLFRRFRGILFCTRTNNLLSAAWRWLLHLVRARLIAFLSWVLKSACTLSSWTDVTIRVLSESQDKKAQEKHKTQFQLRKFSRKQSEELGTQDVISPAKPVPPPLAIRIPYISLPTPPPTPDSDLSSGFGFISTSNAALLTKTNPESAPLVSDYRLSANVSNTVCDASHVLTIMNPSQDVSDILHSFDCSDAFMSYLSLHEVSGKSAYGFIYHGIGYGNEHFAIKFFKRDGILDHDAAFVDEIAALERVEDSDWAPKLRYWQCSEEHLLIAMTYFSGGNVYDYARPKRSIDPELSIFWTAEMLLGLHWLHTLGIVHRDIKPENMMLDATGHVKIFDFSTAKIFDHDSVSREEYPLFYSLRRTGGDLFPQIWALDSNPHTTNEAFGTQGFAPPEVWQCKYYSYGVDYFAMGCVLHELLTGNLPFAYDSAVDKYDVFTIVVDPDYVLEGVQRDFLKKALMPNPVLRPSVSHMKRHVMFQNIDWSALSRFDAKPPIRS